MRDDYEKLGVFYIGREFDVAQGKRQEDLVLFESKKLVTHGLVVGMTGSGKTGLCIDLLEEAAMDGIPAIMVDPKGDLGNLLLTFPELNGEKFRSWVDSDEAARRGMTVEQFAEAEAGKWRRGLEQWGQTGERIRHLKEKSDITIYTPRSNTGVPVSILGSLQVPPSKVLEDPEALQSRASSTVAGLLSLLGMADDSTNSREGAVLTTLLQNAWNAGESPNLENLVHKLQHPGFDKIGVLPLESYFPAKERFELAIKLNNLLAMPSFQAWLTGNPLDVRELLYTKQGKPRQAIFSISHLNDNERMFFLTLLLNEVLSWARTQSGTSSLRALLYIDEIFGFFPPVANPPSKQPLLTLLKQARAFGLGVVLATQNPADLDYKGLGNIGTWFIGRLQTGRDRQRLLDGLEGAAAGKGGHFDREQMDKLIASLPARVFLLHSVHNDEPVIFETRWAMSYLKGPLAQEELKKLRKPGAEGPESVKKSNPGSSAPPVLGPDVPQFWLPAPAGAYFEPRILACAQVRYVDAASQLDTTEDVCVLAVIEDSPSGINWNSAEERTLDFRSFGRSPIAGEYSELPKKAASSSSYKEWSKDFLHWVLTNRKSSILKAPAYKLASGPGETEVDFRLRVMQWAREERDEAAETLRRKYEAKFATIEERIRRAEVAKEREAEQAGRAKMEVVVALGSTLLGAFLGKRKFTSGTIGRATSTVKGAGRAYEQTKDVERAGENFQVLQEQLKELEAQLHKDLEAMTIAYENPEIAKVQVSPRKTDVILKALALLWVPLQRNEFGGLVS